MLYQVVTATGVTKTYDLRTPTKVCFFFITLKP